MFPVVDKSYQCDYASCSKSPMTYVDFFLFFTGCSGNYKKYGCSALDVANTFYINTIFPSLSTLFHISLQKEKRMMKCTNKVAIYQGKGMENEK
jgi:hypothetical protein